jgi:hypothetical protein
MKYNWRQIFKEKDDKELIRIYSGKSHLNYEASVYAGLELKRRNFDFQKIEAIHKNKLNQLENDIREYKDLDFFRTKYFRRLVLNTLALIGFIILFLKYKEEIVNNQSEYIRIWIYIFALSITIATAKWSYNRFKRDKRKTIEHKTALLNKLDL